MLAVVLWPDYYHVPVDQSNPASPTYSHTLALSLR